MATVPPYSDGPEQFTRHTFVRRVGGAVLGASFLSARSFPLIELA